MDATPQRHLGLAYEGRRPESLANHRPEATASSPLLGILIGLALTATVAIAGTLFTLAVFGYSLGELL